jgi:predicted secreted protein
MTIDWQQLITTFGGGAAVLAAAAWLVRTALNHALDRDAETFKARLKADADVEVEKLKSSLQMAAYEHETKFSTLHAKRAEVIAEIFRRYPMRLKQRSQLQEQLLRASFADCPGWMTVQRTTELPGQTIRSYVLRE